MTSHTPDSQDTLPRSENDGQTHLQQQLQFARNWLGLALVKGLGAIATLQQPSVSALSRSDSVVQVVHLPACNQRRHYADLI